ncbi:hypothetical protein L1049_006477 [Liquidambar formosana]|uniref:3'-5' exonuclease domain-containing protein n=1 Tax=Liquidambar formosana TaxID=63359 RepID=A0AAP0WRF8_LIQFO
MEISSTPIIHRVKFFEDIIETTMAKTTGDVDQWIDKVCETSFTDQCKPEDFFVGLDSEYALILQLCFNRRCLIFQLWCAVEIPTSLINFLQNPKFTFIGIAIERDDCLLSKYYGLSLSHNRKNLPSLAEELYPRGGFNCRSLKELARVCLKKEVQKPIETINSDWKAKDLSIPQIEYACIDAFVALEVGIYLYKMSLNVAELSYHSDENVEYWSDGDEVESSQVHGPETPTNCN